MLKTTGSTMSAAASPAALSQITSRINSVLSVEGIARTLAESVSLISFDYCCLILPAFSGGGSSSGGYRVWRTMCANPGSLQMTVISSNAACSLFAEALAGGEPLLLLNCKSMSQLQGLFTDLEFAAHSAIALPLSVEGNPFGLLCFVSSAPDAYTSHDLQNLQWLADHVAAATQAALLREQLEVATDGLREISRLKSGFINTLARDVRLPLTNILSLLELFASKLQVREPFDRQDRELLGGSIEQSDRMRRLVDELLEVTQHQERPLHLDVQGVEASHLLGEVAEPVRGEAALRGVEVQVHVAASTPQLLIDAPQTRRALHHVLDVALAATPDGGIVKIEAYGIAGMRATDAGRRYVLVSITDSSEGLAAEEAPFVFDAFWQPPDSSGNSGWGLGLAVAKRIVAAHGGSVSVRSQVGIGTTYAMLLPARTTREAIPTPHRILVVDDTPELLTMLGKLIKSMNYGVVTAANGAQAMEALNQQQISLVITDWALPGINGNQLIAALKEDARWRHIPTIVLTGHATEITQRAAQRVGCDRFLVKPVKRDELQRAIDELLAA